MKKVKLLSNRVLAVEGGEEEKTDGGLILPSQTGANDEISSGIVVEVGPGKDGEEMFVKVGDRIMFQFPTKINLNGKNHFLVREDDIIMVVEK